MCKFKFEYSLKFPDLVTCPMEIAYIISIDLNLRCLLGVYLHITKQRVIKNSSSLVLAGSRENLNSFKNISKH